MCSNYETILIFLSIILPVAHIILLVSYLENNPGIEECGPAGLPSVSCASVPEYTCPEAEYVYFDDILTTTAAVELEPLYYGFAIYFGTLSCYSYALLIVWRFNLIRYNLQNTADSPWDNNRTMRNCWKLAQILGVIWVIFVPLGTVFYPGPHDEGHKYISVLFGVPFFAIYPCCHSCWTSIETKSTSNNVCKWVLCLIFIALTLLSSLSMILWGSLRGNIFEWALLFFSLIQFPFYSCYLGNWCGVANLRTAQNNNERTNTEMSTTI